MFYKEKYQHLDCFLKGKKDYETKCFWQKLKILKIQIQNFHEIHIILFILSICDDNQKSMKPKIKLLLKYRSTGNTDCRLFISLINFLAFNKIYTTITFKIFIKKFCQISSIKKFYFLCFSFKLFFISPINMTMLLRMLISTYVTNINSTW